MSERRKQFQDVFKTVKKINYDDLDDYAGVKKPEMEQVPKEPQEQPEKEAAPVPVAEAPQKEETPKPELKEVKQKPPVTRPAKNKPKSKTPEEASDPSSDNFVNDMDIASKINQYAPIKNRHSIHIEREIFEVFEEYCFSKKFRNPGVLINRILEEVIQHPEFKDIVKKKD